MDDPPIEWLLAGFPAARVGAATRFRALVRRAVPAAIEVPGAFNARTSERLAFGYRIPVDRRRAPLFAWVLVQTEHVHLGFEHGAMLADPDDRLEGLELRRVRFVTVRSAEEIDDETGLAAWTREAAQAARWTRAERLARLLDAGAEPAADGPDARRFVRVRGGDR